MTRTLKHKLFVTFTFLLVLGLNQKTIAAETDAAGAPDLEGSNWQLVRLVVLGGYEFIPEEPEKFVLNFRGSQRLTGSSDCNELGGLWIQDEFALHFEPFLTSRRLCEPGSLHSNFSLYIRDAAKFEFLGDNMLITTNTEGIELEFEPR